VARPTYNLHQCLNIMDSEPTNGKLFCVNQQQASIHQPIQHIQIYRTVTLGLEQQHEQLCSNTPRGAQVMNCNKLSLRETNHQTSNVPNPQTASTVPHYLFHKSFHCYSFQSFDSIIISFIKHQQTVIFHGWTGVNNVDHGLLLTTLTEQCAAEPCVCNLA